MEFLKNIGAVCRLHYEKILLTLVLFGLAVTVAFLYHATQSEAEKIQDFLKVIAKKKVAGVNPVNLGRSGAVIQQAQTPPAFNLSAPHYLFNPVKWQRLPDGRLVKITSDQDLIKNIQLMSTRPLNFVIAFDRVAGSGYWFNVTNEVAIFPAPRRQIQFAILNVTNTSNKIFVLREVHGDTTDPAGFVLELRDTGDRISVVRDKPYIRPDAYEADLRLVLENKTFTKQRVGSKLRSGGDEYKIVAINQNEVVLSASSNDKKYIIRLAAAQ
jgi:hypothetical protein